MFDVSDRALGSFSRQSEASFDRRAVAFLAEQFPDLAMLYGQRGMHQFVVAGQNRATLAGCRSEHEVMLFLSMQAMFGQDFDMNPAYQSQTRVLFAQDIPMEIRLDRALANLTDSAGQMR